MLDFLILQRVIFCYLCLMVGCFRNICPYPAGGLIELEVCLFFISFAGMAHGALDYLTDDGIKDGITKNSLLITSYVVSAIVYFALWIVSPICALTVFLSVSILHFAGLEFGLCRKLRHPKELQVRDLLNLSLSGLAVFLPSALKPSQSEPIISALLNNDGYTHTLLKTMSMLGFIWLGVSAFLVYHILLDRKKKSSKEEVLTCFEVVSLVLLCLQVSPIVAFTVYFCALHSLEETIRLSFQLHPNKAVIGFLRFLYLTGLPTAIVLTGGTCLYFFLINNGGTVAASISKALFVTVSCVTLPHVISRSLSKNKSGLDSKLSMI